MLQQNLWVKHLSYGQNNRSKMDTDFWAAPI
jgi:hypothetical protein